MLIANWGTTLTVFIFSGPTLTAADVRVELPDAVVLPPAAQGDVYRAAKHAPVAIGIIDGYFERVPSVWHKEILWAMHEGIHVYGAASMGALRAAELAAFGMVGVGAIYQAFTSGVLEDDDEVAVAHASAEEGHQALSTAMVDIRATLEAARHAGVISVDEAAALIAIAKQMFYPERVYPTILARAAGVVPTDALDALRAWLPEGMVAQKRLDALALLRQIRTDAESGLGRKRVSYSFQHTEVWDNAIRAVTIGAAADTASGVGELLDELRIAGQYADVYQAALLRFYGLQEARFQGIALSPELVGATAQDFLAAHGLAAADALAGWLADNDLTADGFRRLIEQTVLLSTVDALSALEALRHLPDVLRHNGSYAALLRRAQQKAKLLAAQGLENPSLADAGLTAAALWHWYFVELGKMKAVPTDIDAAARALGLGDAADLRRILLREYCFRALLAQDS